MKLKQMFSVSAVAAAAALSCASGAQATTWFGFEGGSQLINCAFLECYRPPDTMGAVGTTQFMETNNGSIRIYDKMTGAVQSSVSMTAFWANAGQPGGAFGDQRVLFDHYTNRWVALGFGSTTNKINIGVSDTADALGPWKSVVNVALPSGIADYPTLAMDNKGVYIGTNNFTAAGSFTGTSLFVIPKASLVNAGAPTLAGMTNLTTPYPAGPDNGFAIQAAVNWQGNPGNVASVMADSRDANAQVFYKVNGVNAAGATQTASGYIAGSEYTPAGAGRQPDGTRLVDTLSPRITGNVVQSNGKLYSAITVDDGTDHAAVRWSVNDADTGVIIESGLISGGGFDYYEGSVAVNEFGEAVIGYNRSGFETADVNGDGLADGNISFLARTFATDGGGGLDQAGSDLLLRVSGISDYRCGEHSPPDNVCRQRWGDYSAVTIDPTNHHNFYAIGQYASAWSYIPEYGVTRAIWNTYIASINVVPEPGTYAMLLAGLAVVGGVARRRRSV